MGWTLEDVKPCSATVRRMWYLSTFGFIASNTLFAFPGVPSDSGKPSRRYWYDEPAPPAQSWCVPALAPPKFSVFVVRAPVFGFWNVNVLLSLIIGLSPMESCPPTWGPGTLVAGPNTPSFWRTVQAFGFVESAPPGSR